jgi:hypothetical protein
MCIRKKLLKKCEMRKLKIKIQTRPFCGGCCCEQNKRERQKSFSRKKTKKWQALNIRWKIIVGIWKKKYNEINEGWNAVQKEKEEVKNL